MKYLNFNNYPQMRLKYKYLHDILHRSARLKASNALERVAKSGKALIVVYDEEGKRRIGMGVVTLKELEDDSGRYDGEALLLDSHTVMKMLEELGQNYTQLQDKYNQLNRFVEEIKSSFIRHEISKL